MSIDIFKFDKIPSTNTKCQQLVEEGRRPPFVVLAKSQTEGKGRHGKSWQSALGGIYFSVALTYHQKKIDSWLSMKSSCLLVQVIEEIFGFRPDIKWPNDLIYQGQKFAGQLIECQVTPGEEKLNLIIGIGLNIFNSSSITNTEQPYTDIQSILNSREEWDCTLLGEKIVKSLLDKWDSLPDFSAVKNAYNQLSKSQGRLWQHKTNSNELWIEDQLDESGALVLKRPTLGKFEKKVINSVHHDFEIAYAPRAEKQQTPLVVLEVGNSNSKFAVFSNPFSNSIDRISAVANEMLASGNILELVNDIKESYFAGYSLLPIYYSAVNPEAAQRLIDSIDNTNVCLIPIQKRTDSLILGSYPIGQIGFDRIACMEGWLSKRKKVSESYVGIVISLGTATTIDVLTNSGHHLGGYIIPGMQTALSTLHQKTGLLPALDLKNLNFNSYVDSPLNLGLNTEQSMLFGQIRVLKSLVASLKLDIQKHCPDHRCEIVYTGGNATTLHKLHIFREASHVEDLVFQGLKAITI